MSCTEQCIVIQEFQYGCHIPLYACCRDAPNMDTQEGRDAAPAFIDSVVSTRIPEEPDDPEQMRLRYLVTKVTAGDHMPVLSLLAFLLKTMKHVCCSI